MKYTWIYRGEGRRRTSEQREWYAFLAEDGYDEDVVDGTVWCRRMLIRFGKKLYSQTNHPSETMYIQDFTQVERVNARQFAHNLMLTYFGGPNPHALGKLSHWCRPRTLPQSDIADLEEWRFVLYSSCQKNRRMTRMAGPTRPSYSEHALTASLVQVPPRFCAATLWNGAHRLIYPTRAVCSISRDKIWTK